MADKTISRLMKYRPLLYDELNVADILDYLEKFKVVTSSEKYAISKENLPERKIDVLLACLVRYGDGAYTLFLNALNTTRGKYAGMVSILEKEDDKSILQRNLPLIPWQATAESLKHFPWYADDIDRDQATKLIEMIGEEGSYLVRLGSMRETPCPFVLTVLSQGRVWHVQIGKRADQRYGMGVEKPTEKAFTSIPDLIQYFHSNDLYLRESDDNTISVNLTRYPLK